MQLSMSLYFFLDIFGKCFPFIYHCGDYGEEVPPVLIPNTEVKLFSAECTWLDTARETMTLPHPLNDYLGDGRFFFLLGLQKLKIQQKSKIKRGASDEIYDL